MNMKLNIKSDKMTFTLIQLLLVTALVAGASKFISDHPISTIFKAGNEEKQVKLAFHPNDLKPEPDDTVNITPFLSANGKKPGFITVTLRYDNIHLTFDSSDSTHLDDKYDMLFPIESKDVEADGRTYGAITLSYAIKDLNSLPGDSIELSRLTFKVNGRDKTVVSPVMDDSQIVFVDSEQGDLIPDQAVVDSTEKPTPTPSPMPTEASGPENPPAESPQTEISQEPVPADSQPVDATKEIPPGQAKTDLPASAGSSAETQTTP